MSTVSQLLRIVMETDSTNSNLPPDTDIDDDLMDRYAPLNIIGLSNCLGNNGDLYFKLYCRLVDKANFEYRTARARMIDDLQMRNSKNGCMIEITRNMIKINNHLENCINALNRAIKIRRGISKELKDDFPNIKKEDRKNIEKKFDQICLIRDGMEHMNDDIRKKEVKGDWIAISVDIDFRQIRLNGGCIMISEIAEVIDQLWAFGSKIIDTIPGKSKI